MEEVVQKGLMRQAGVIGAYIKSQALQLQKEFPSIIKEVRGMGCMLGIDIDRDGQPIVDELLNRGMLINCTNTTVLRLLPPYIITAELCDQLMFELRSILKTIKV
jgi:acetylornithine/succinyldiaminopimelate/putrescine aminotransferase